MHVEDDRELKDRVRGKTFERMSKQTKAFEQFAMSMRARATVSAACNCARIYVVAEGKGGSASTTWPRSPTRHIERILTAPFTGGHDTHVKTTNATCMALATNQPVRPDRNKAMAQTPVSDAG